jgi:two-component system, sensor histidine kinase and response regulator
MHKLLLRQIKRTLGADEQALPLVLAQLQAITLQPGVTAEVTNFLQGLDAFFARVDEAYVQSDRDLELKTRSLELSSVELSGANTRLREELESRTRAIDSLRDTARGLMASIEGEGTEPLGDNLESLSDLMAKLVLQKEASQKDLQLALVDLANQKFALDQHAIVSITNVAGEIIYANDKMCEISGYSRVDLIGKTHRLINSGVHPAAFFTQLWATITAGQVWHGEICNKAKDGRLYWVDATIVPLRDDAGQPTMYIAIRTDITERKGISEELQKAKEGAEAANRAKSDFLANMSHEIRTPMNGVIGMTELLLDTPLNSEQQEYLGIVKSSSEALLRVINDILDFSKIEAGKLQVEHIPFNLGRAVSDSLKTLALRAHEKGLELVCDIASDVPMAVTGDPGRLRQILVNIIGNSIKFTATGEVVLQITRAADVHGKAMLHFAVSDTGIGIPQNKLSTIFEAFSQEDSSTTRRYGGTGLGLTICARLCEAMGGRIWVESVQGKGSVFHFTLHLPIDSAANKAAAVMVRLDDVRVLLVDDNAVNRMVVAKSLEAAGASVQEAESGDAALQILAMHAEKNEAICDLVLLDGQMPGMDGYATAQRIHSMPLYADTPMVMLSSAGVKGDAQRARTVGISGYLSKPLARDELLQLLGKVLGHRTDRKEVLVTRHSLKDEQNPLNILLVEDHAVNQKLATTLLQRWGHTVTVADNGKIAVDLVQQHAYDIVLMDMMMPVMDGLDATRSIRAAETQRRVPIIAMTANAMEADRQRCLDAGMDDYISKPIKADDLKQKLLRYSTVPEIASIFGALDDVATASGPLQKRDEPFDYATALQAADQEMVDIVAGAFIEQWPADIQKMHVALQAQNYPGVLHTAHALKGTLSMFGAAPASEMAMRIESLAAAQDAAAIADLLDIFDSEVQQFLNALSASRRK